jgi:hypothetical protein
MKTLLTRSAVVIATVFTAVTVGAIGPVAPKTTSNSAVMERELQRQIDKYVSYPLMAPAGSMDGAVAVSFVINTEGQVKVIGADGTSDELRDYVLRKLAKVDIGSNPDGLWRTTYMKFNFRPEM